MMKPSPNAQHREGNSSPSSNRRVTVGFDYGTQSTKVQIRWRGDRRSRVILVDDRPTLGYPVFATPSAVRVHEGRVFFGRRAVEKEMEGNFYKSLKTQLLPPDHELGQERIVFPDGLDPELLIGCYMAWAFGAIARTLDAPADQVALNVAAPMNHVEDAELKGKYLRIIQSAWEAVFGETPISVDQGMRIDDLRGFFGYWFSREVPDSDTRRYEVQPETIAPLASLSEDPRMEPGMYLMVDMGAGTTELSVNYVTGDYDGPKVICYEDSSIRLGGDDFAKLAGREDWDGALSRRLKLFQKAFNRVWLPGFQKDGTHAAREKWRKLWVIQAGGGGRHSDIQKLLKKELPKPQWTVAEESYRVQWREPYGLILNDLPQALSRKDLPLLSVSHGLSMERQRWPEYFTPGEVETHARPAGAWSQVTDTYPDDK